MAIKKAQVGKKVVKKPTYKNLRMGVANQSKVEGRDYTETATKQDSINYNRGFLRGLKKDKETRNDIDEVEKAGRWEGLNTKKNGGPVKKAKTGAKMKKAKDGKSFPDLNKDGKVTKADILKGRGVIAKNGKPVEKAFLGKMLGGVGKSVLGGLAGKAIGGLMGGKGKGGMFGGLLGKDGKTIKKSKSGTSMKKCKYGCK